MQCLDKGISSSCGSTTGSIEQKPLVESVFRFDTRIPFAESCSNNVRVFTYLARV
jgi:hypothetical protein